MVISMEHGSSKRGEVTVDISTCGTQKRLNCSHVNFSIQIVVYLEMSFTFQHGEGSLLQW